MTLNIVLDQNFLDQRNFLCSNVDMSGRLRPSFLIFRRWISLKMNCHLKGALQILIKFAGKPYLLKRGTTWNHLKPAKTTWNQPYYSIFHLKQVILRLSLSLYSTLKSLLGKSGLKIWNSPDWLRFGTGVHCYILISI